MQDGELDRAEKLWLVGEIDAETYFQVVFRAVDAVGQRELDKALNKGQPLTATWSS
jgi:methionine synthase II (cobalamin-independent)